MTVDVQQGAAATQNMTDLDEYDWHWRRLGNKNKTSGALNSAQAKTGRKFRLSVRRYAWCHAIPQQ